MWTWRGNILTNKTCRSLAVVALVVCAGCSTSPETGKAPRQTEAHSFNVIKGVDSSGSFLLNGYSDYKNSASQALAPGAVLVVGVQDGVTLGGQRFEYEAIVLVEGDENRPTFRQAAENDAIVLANEVSVFGRKLPKGPLKIPTGGTFSDPATQPSSGTKGALSVP